MSSDEEKVPRGKRIELIILTIATVTSVASVVVNVVYTQQSLRQSQQQYAASQPKLDVQDDVADAAITAHTSPTSATIFIDYELQNIGGKPVRGCLTYFEGVTKSGKPYTYFPSIYEPGGVSWSLNPGSTHETDMTIPMSAADFRDQPYLSVWFECTNPHLVTDSEIEGVNIAQGKLLSRRLPQMTLPPLSVYQRANTMMKIVGIPKPKSTSVPPFVILPDEPGH